MNRARCRCGLMSDDSMLMCASELETPEWLVARWSINIQVLLVDRRGWAWQHVLSDGSESGRRWGPRCLASVRHLGCSQVNISLGPGRQASTKTFGDDVSLCELFSLSRLELMLVFCTAKKFLCTKLAVEDVLVDTVNFGNCAEDTAEQGLPASEVIKSGGHIRYSWYGWLAQGAPCS